MYGAQGTALRLVEGLRSLFYLAALIVVTAPACAELPGVPSGTCGNLVLDPGEDCDQPGAACIAPGRLGQCRYACAPASQHCADPSAQGCGCAGGACAC